MKALKSQYADDGVLDLKAQMKVMLTGGFRSRAAMEAAIAEGDLDVIGVGRPLCGSPQCVQQLLERQIDVLPGYEDELQPGGSTCAGRSEHQLKRARLTQLVVQVCEGLIEFLQAWQNRSFHRVTILVLCEYLQHRRQQHG